MLHMTDRSREALFFVFAIKACLAQTPPAETSPVTTVRADIESLRGYVQEVTHIDVTPKGYFYLINLSIECPASRSPLQNMGGQEQGSQIRLIGQGASEFLGMCGGLFHLTPSSDNVVEIAYPDTAVSLRLRFVNNADSTISIADASYQGGGCWRISKQAAQELQRWTAKLPARLVVSQDALIEITVPNPNAPDVSEGERTACDRASNAVAALTFGTQGDSYSLKINSLPQGAAVYVNGHHIGNTNLSIGSRKQRVDIVIRKGGFADFAQTLTLTDQSNELSVSLNPSKVAQ
jgi:hypothetical protein